jgi:hypothetical protein
MVLLLGCALALSLGNASTPNASSTSPLILAKRRLVNQTAPIPATTIFTPTQSGLYRLSMYATVTQANPSTNDNWYTHIYWSDDAGAEESNAAGDILSWNSGNTPPSAWANSTGDQPGLVITFEAVAGMPISYAVDGVADGSAFSLYYVVELLD